VLSDLDPGAEATVDVAVQSNQFGQSLADRLVGQLFFDSGSTTPDAARLYVRRNMVDQLTWDPNMGSTNLLPADGPVVLAWGSGDLVDVEIEGQRPNRVGNVLYYLPAKLAVSGSTTFRFDLIRSTILDSDAGLFSKEPRSMSFGRGSTTVAYRPIGLDGSIDATRLEIALTNFDRGIILEPTPVVPLATIPPPCPDPPTGACAILDQMPEVEVFDVEAQAWRRLPHLTPGTRYAVAGPERFVDPVTGTALIRYVNERVDPVYFSPDVTIGGTVR
jgi:hypothetical protein